MATAFTKSSELMTAIRAGILDGVLMAIAHGADIEETDMHGYPGLPLRTACFSGHFDIVLALLTHGANVNAPTADGSGAPLRLARRAKHERIASLLLEHGAEIPFDTQRIPAKASPSDRSDLVHGVHSTAPLQPSSSSAVLPGNLRRTSRSEENTIEFASFSVPPSPVQPSPALEHGNSIEFTPSASPSPPKAVAPQVTVLPNFTDPPPRDDTFDQPAPEHIEEIEMSVPYGVDTEILARELSKIEQQLSKTKA